MSHNNGLQACLESVLTILSQLDIEYFLCFDAIVNSARVRPQVVFLNVQHNQRNLVLIDKKNNIKIAVIRGLKTTALNVANSVQFIAGKTFG